jgi:branched-chain amino acid transport system permease protein
MIGKPLLTVVMVTIALSLIIRSVVQIVYGTAEKTLPSVLPSESLKIVGLRVSELDLIVMGVTAVCVLGFALFFRFSNMGLQMRATAENVEASMLSGIDANRVFMVAFGLGTATAALGGALMANLQVVSPQLSALGLLAFPAAVIGGLTSIPGAIVGGLIIGVVQQLAVGYVSGQAANVFVYGILLAVLLLRPYGLFGRPTVARV